MPSVPKGKASDAIEADSGGANALVEPRTPQEIERAAFEDTAVDRARAGFFDAPPGSR